MSAKLVRGGDKLKLLLDTVKNTRGHAKVGWFANNIYPNGTPVANVAIYNEYGYQDGNRHVPARPFMRKAFNEKHQVWSMIILNKLHSQNGSYNFIQALEFGAIQASSDIQTSILGGGWVTNAESTIKGKGFNKPLIDTGLMLKLVNYSIKL